MGENRGGALFYRLESQRPFCYNRNKPADSPWGGCRLRLPEATNVTDRMDPLSGSSGRRTLTLRADLPELDRARRFLKDTLQSFRLDEEEFFKLELALVEICVNIIRYAYPGGGGTITVAVGSVPGVCLEIRDSGRPFDPRLLPSPDLDDHMKEGRKSGLGVYLARSLVDDFDYRREGGENIVTLSKCLPAAPCD
jgi:serine/threonine-protein kinase RsbW